MGSPKCYVATFIVLVLIAGGIAGILFWLKPWEKSEQESQGGQPLSDLLIKTADGTIKLVTHTDGDYSKGQVLVEEYINGILGFDHYKDKIYYGTSTPNNPIFSSSNERLNSASSWTKTALAVDFITENLYVLDRMDQKLHVIDMQDQYQAVILTDLDDPRDIVLDPEMGLMFILQSSSILRSNMDGTDAGVVMDVPSPSAIAIDRHNKLLYFATFESLISYDYRKRESKEVMKITSRVISLSVTKSEVFFVSIKASDTSVKDLNYCLMSQDGLCHEKQTRVLTSSTNIQEVKGYESHEQASTSNPCKSNSCSNLCILKNSVTGPSLGYSCACTTGMVSMNNNTSCRPATTHLLYIQDEKIRVKVVSTESSAFDQADESKFQFDISSLSTRDKVDFDYHYRLNLIIFTDGSTIHYTNLMDGSHWQVQGTSGCSYANPAIDWVSNCVYYIKRCVKAYSIVRRGIETVGGDSGESTVIKIESAVIESLAIHPGLGWIFYLQKEGDSRKFYTVSMDGSIIHETPDYSISAFTVDAKSSHLFWLIHSLSGVLQVYLKDWTSDLHSEFPNVAESSAIAATGTSIYLSNSANIWTASGSIFPGYASGNIGTIRAAKLIGADVQYVDERWNHPCISKNGGCSRYCLATKKENNEPLVKMCDCNDDESLESDGLTCKKKGSHGPSSDILIKTSDGTIKLVTATDGDYSKGKVLVEEYINGILSFDHYEDKIYYGTSIPNSPIFSSSNERLNSASSWTKTALAVDFITKKLYVLDRMDQKLHVVDLQDRYQAVILTDLNDPRDIVLDPEMGLMFILQSTSILRFSMDGTGAEDIYEDPELNAIAIDRHNKILYFATSDSLISYDYRTKNIGVVMAITSRVISLSVMKNDIFFVSIRASNTTVKDLNYCSLEKNGLCNEEQIQMLTSSTNIQEIKSYESHEESFDPCESNPCPNLCILKNSKTNPLLDYSCACTTGMVPMNNNTSCRPATTHLLYVQDEKIRVKVVSTEGSKFDQADESKFQFDISSLSTRDKVDFDYHYRLNLIIFTDGSTIHYTNLTDGSHWQVQGTSGCSYANPAIDWVSNCVYLIKECKSFQENSIVRRGIKNIDAAKGESSLIKYETKIGSLTIHPGYGVIFYTLYNTHKYGRIHSLSVDGIKYKNIAEGQAFIETGLAVDARLNNLYALVETSEKVLEISLKTCFETPHTDFSGENDFNDITVSRGLIFASNLKGIWTAKGSIFPSYASGNIGTIKAAKLIGPDVQYVDERWNHPCISKNGGCSRYCLATKVETNGKLVKKCGCNDDEIIHSNGTCSKKLP